MSIMCDVTTCKHNIGGFCDRVDIYISDAEMGEPICQDMKFCEEETEHLTEVEDVEENAGKLQHH